MEDEKQIVKSCIKKNKKKACRLVNKILKEMDKKIEDAPLNQLSSVLGMLLDKFGSDERPENSEGLLNTVFEDFEDVK